MNYEQQIKKLAAEKNAIILAHNYQPAEIQDVADICGDSLERRRQRSQRWFSAECTSWQKRQRFFRRKRLY